MTSLDLASADRPDQATTASGLVSWYSEGFRDRLGDRLLLFDNVGVGLELLRMDPRLARAEGFEAALRARVEDLKQFRHPAFSRVRTVKWLDEPAPQLAVVSEHVAGERLSRVLQLARTRGLRAGPDAAVWLIRQLLPALAALHGHTSGGHGLLTADSVIVMPDGRLAIADHAVGAAVEARGFSPSELWQRFGVTPPAGTVAGVFDPAADVQHVARLALAMLSGPPVVSDEPESPADLLDRAREPLASGGERLRAWFARALAIGESPFESAEEAHAALESMLPRTDGAWAGWLLPGGLDAAPATVTSSSPAPIASPQLAGGQALVDLAAQVRESRAARKRPSPRPAPRTVSAKQLPASLLLFPSEAEAPGPARSVFAALTGNGIVQQMCAWATPRENSLQVRRLRLLSGGLAAVALVEAVLLVGGVRKPASASAMRSARASVPASAIPSAVPKPSSTGRATAAPALPATAPAVVDAAARGTTGETHPVALPPATFPTHGAHPAPPAPRGVIGWLAVKSDVDVRVYANGRLLGSGTGGRYRLPEGTHDITLVNESAGVRVTRTVRIVPGQTVDVAGPQQR